MEDVIGGKQLAVLQIIYRQSGEGYGVSISDQLRADGSPTVLPQIYSILDKLVQKGLVEAKMGEPTAERGGRRKRLYSITGKGSRVLALSLSEHPRVAQRGGWIATGESDPVAG